MRKKLLEVLETLEMDVHGRISEDLFVRVTVTFRWGGRGGGGGSNVKSKSFEAVVNMFEPMREAIDEYCRTHKTSIGRGGGLLEGARGGGFKRRRRGRQDSHPPLAELQNTVVPVKYFNDAPPPGPSNRLVVPGLFDSSHGAVPSPPLADVETSSDRLGAALSSVLTDRAICCFVLLI
jgi:hypothetical protein